MRAIEIEQQFSEIISDAIKYNWHSYCIREINSNGITYGDFGNRMLAVCHFLQLKNIQPNDKVILIAPNSIDWCVIYLAVIIFGAVIVPLSPILPVDYFNNLLNHSEAKIAIVSDDIKDKIVDFALEKQISIFSVSDEAFYCDHVNIGQDAFCLPSRLNNKLSIINYTSGTCDSPKGVMLSLIPIVRNLRFAQHNLPLRNGDNIVSAMPFTHSFGCLFEFLYPFSVGATINLLHKKPTPQIIREVFNVIHPKVFFSVPLVIEKIFYTVVENKEDFVLLEDADDELKAKYRRLFMSYFSSSCKLIGIGGAKLNPRIERILTHIGIPFACGYGMTECGPVISWSNPPVSKLYSVGQLVEGMQGKIINVQDGNGEILLKGANLMLGYFKNSTATADTIDEEGWLHTGDIGYIDAEGFVFLKARKKNVILRNDGINVYIDDIERIIKDKCPNIDDCVVFERGNKIIARVVFSSKCKNLSASLANINKYLPRNVSISQIEIENDSIKRNLKNEICRKIYK